MTTPHLATAFVRTALHLAVGYPLSVRPVVVGLAAGCSPAVDPVAAHLGAAHRTARHVVGSGTAHAGVLGAAVRAGSERRVLLGAAGGAALGASAGLAGRVLLGRLRRGIECRPPWSELAAALLTCVLGVRAAAGSLPWWWLPVPVLLGWLAVPMAAVDLRRHRLPDALTLPAYPVLGLAIAAAAIACGEPGRCLAAAAGALAFGGAHALARACAPGSLGAGDVKLAGSLGAVLGAVGWAALPVAAVLAAAITAGLAVATARSRAAPAGRRLTEPPAVAQPPRPPGATRRRRYVPHGPGLLGATWLVAAFPGTAFPGPGVAWSGAWSPGST